MKPDTEIPLVVHVIYSLGTGGLENGLVNIINHMPDERYRHAIICLTEAGEFAKRIARPGVPLISLHSEAGHSFRLYWKLWKVLKTLNPTIVHTRNLAALEAQIPAWFLSGASTVHGEHGRDVFDIEGKNRKYNLLRKAVSLFVDRYVAVSRDLQYWLLKTVGVAQDKVIQIYNGVDQDLFRPKDGVTPDIAPAGFLSEKPFVIGTVGRLAAVKDQATLISAFKGLLDQNPGNRRDFRLIIAGEGPMRRQLEELILRWGLAEYVWMAGERNDISELLRLFDVFVLPSLGEGISNTLLEAMATGLPVIATDVGGNPELVEDGVNGRLVPKENPASITACLQEFVSDRELVKTMGEAGLGKVRSQFNWDRTVEQYISVYDGLVGG